MSKILHPIQLIPVAFVLILQFFTFAGAQDVETTISIKDPPKAGVSGQFLRRELFRPMDSFELIRAFVGGTGVTGRLLELRGRDESSQTIFHALPGSMLSSSSAKVQNWDARFSFDSFVLPGAANVSWLSKDGGIIMLDDLLPQPTSSLRAQVDLDLPPRWKAYSAESSDTRSRYVFSNAEKGIIVVGPNWREHNADKLRLLILGEWNFTDEDVIRFSDSLLADYGRLFGTVQGRKPMVVIARSPASVMSGNWEADARGSTITILSSDMPFPNQSLQRLHEQLRHEIFHLWIPNGVNLTGNYDWFYEGFALYQSLKLGVGVNRIRFDDYLDTLSRAYAIDARQSVKTTMIESSRNRWNGSNTDVYARGMLVAFLCDLAMLDASKGKRSTNELLREIYSKHSGNAKPEDGNVAILALMKRHPELTPITERYVTGAEKLDWAELIKAAGIEAEAKSGRLSVSAKLSGRQRDLLDKLGYNSWRKLANEKR